MEGKLEEAEKINLLLMNRVVRDMVLTPRFVSRRCIIQWPLGNFVLACISACTQIESTYKGRGNDGSRTLYDLVGRVRGPSIIHYCFVNCSFKL